MDSNCDKGMEKIYLCKPNSVVEFDAPSNTPPCVLLPPGTKLPEKPKPKPTQPKPKPTQPKQPEKPAKDSENAPKWGTSKQTTCSYDMGSYKTLDEAKAACSKAGSGGCGGVLDTTCGQHGVKYTLCYGSAGKGGRRLGPGGGAQPYSSLRSGTGSSAAHCVHTPPKFFEKKLKMECKKQGKEVETLEKAKEECRKSDSCSGVVDMACGFQSRYFLCDESGIQEFSSPGSPSCVYENLVHLAKNPVKCDTKPKVAPKWGTSTKTTCSYDMGSYKTLDEAKAACSKAGSGGCGGVLDTTCGQSGVKYRLCYGSAGKGGRRLGPGGGAQPYSSL